MQQVDYSLLGTRIRLKRKEMGITQAEMAERCGVSVPFIGHIERGSRAPSMESFLGICRVLHVTPDFLLQDYIEFEVMENARNSKITNTDLLTLDKISRVLRESSTEWGD